ncbi:hypothetical protein BDN71DRAFT_636841 [Pleurotus eryngii]|uniref:Uncharacterized protein n=1 Tax=Pleurotus eryngii TaxID=5323 RepID=A0A9P6DHZ2_PLEER|nr:hypothetical protein BDN71DRAFT_636841 [Pleurotus eryngii]
MVRLQAARSSERIRVIYSTETIATTVCVIFGEMRSREAGNTLLIQRRVLIEGRITLNPLSPLTLASMREGAFFLLFLAVTTEATRSRNVTIDDQFGGEITHVAPTHSPSSGWKLAGTGGHAKPNASLAYKATWHDLTHYAGHAAAIANFGFTDTSLCVYCSSRTNCLVHIWIPSPTTSFFLKKTLLASTCTVPRGSPIISSAYQSMPTQPERINPITLAL